MKLLHLFIFISLSFDIKSIYSTPINELNVRHSPTIILNTAAEAPYTKETHDGFLDELATELFSRIGYKLIVIKLPAERALRRANKGLIDGDIIRVSGLNKLYPNLIQIGESIITIKFALFSKSPLDVQKSWSALAQKEIAYITGWKIFEQNVPSSAQVTKTQNSKELFTLLEKGRTDYVLFTLWGGNYLINKFNLTGIHLQLPVMAKREMFMYLHDKYKPLAPKIVAILRKMKKTGYYKRLMNKHLYPYKL